jgi:hypothetical protein
VHLRARSHFHPLPLLISRLTRLSI